jgi:hypothetical protein
MLLKLPPSPGPRARVIRDVLEDEFFPKEGPGSSSIVAAEIASRAESVVEEIVSD